MSGLVLGVFNRKHAVIHLWRGLELGWKHLPTSFFTAYSSYELALFINSYSGLFFEEQALIQSLEFCRLHFPHSTHTVRCQESLAKSYLGNCDKQLSLQYQTLLVSQNAVICAQNYPNWREFHYIRIHLMHCHRWLRRSEATEAQLTRQMGESVHYLHRYARRYLRRLYSG